MAKLIEPAIETPAINTIQVTQISTSANTHAPHPGKLETSSSTSNAEPAVDASKHTLKSLDKHFGPLRIGEVWVSRVELEALGAAVHGQPISASSANLKRPDQAFLDALNFDSAKVDARLKHADISASGVVATLFYEIACKRSIDASPLFVNARPLPPGSGMERLNQLSNAAQKLDIHRVASFENVPGWVSKTKSYVLSGAGVGLQAFGIYSGYMGVMDAIKKGDSLEAVYQGGSIAAEVGSLIIERGLTKTGEAMLRNGSQAFGRFQLTSAGKRLSRGAGLFASAITLPFDITDAVKSFNAAAVTSGKEAQDHYVSGALSVAGAGISLALGVAALAGFGSVAGPLGLAAATILILGSMIYQAARVVDDIDDYIELSAHERLRSGWFAFTGQELDKEVLDRFKISKAFSEHNKQLEVSAKTLLEGAYKNFVEYVVNGSFSVELKPMKIWRHEWNEHAGEQAFKMDSDPVIVGGDDIIDARNGIPANLKGSVKGTPGDDKGVLWRLDDGTDRVIGVSDKSNLFSYREGVKTLTGGNKADEFYFETTEKILNRVSASALTSTLDGGEGFDTLAFEGRRPVTDTRHVGYDVNLHTGKVALRSHNCATDAVDVAQIQSIENISTLRNGVNRITGNDKANRISANGNDHIDAGAGDDTIVLRGADCRVDGGSGQDRYYIADTSAVALIIEDGEQSSVIEFGWPIARIQRWQIVDTSLIVTSLRGKDGEDPDHVLTIANVYQWVEGQRQLKNSQLLFKTQDGYELVLPLPPQMSAPLAQDVEVVISAIGKPDTSPEIINGGTVALTQEGSNQHFVARTQRRVELVARHDLAETSRVIFLEFNDLEIADVIVTYRVEKRDGVSGNTHLFYSNIDISLLLPSKVVVFKGIVQASTQANGYSGRNSLKVTIPRLVQDIVLVTQDGISYRLQLPDIPYLSDADEPGNKIRKAGSCLKPRDGNYLFSRPNVARTIALSAKPNRVDIQATSHSGIYVLRGESSIYDIHLASNTIIRLTTPDATAKIADASIWNLYTSAMTEAITRDDIQLQSDRLWVGSALIELPSMDDNVPVESISVVTRSGNIYEVALLFEVLQLYLINAQSYSSVEALLADIRLHRQRNELAVRVVVQNIGVRPKKDGAVYYHSTNDYWGIDKDPACRIKPEDLVIASDSTP
ncbi:calcium-binding protein [Pseudomonas sp. FP2196]|uniref:calcium-binding protein n=1 Tax=Pseudomonas sp. FP2196 TaxID=2954086 RepID=UPI0027355E3A|nr:calcium-binding protein [Pseudomonas sp. FP2196]WLH34978.1 calcium-binding protein [Pseudomonas sp. FP2196]